MLASIWHSTSVSVSGNSASSAQQTWARSMNTGETLPGQQGCSICIGNAHAANRSRSAPIHTCFSPKVFVSLLLTASPFRSCPGLPRDASPPWRNGKLDVSSTFAQTFIGHLLQSTPAHNVSKFVPKRPPQPRRNSLETPWATMEETCEHLTYPGTSPRPPVQTR